MISASASAQLRNEGNGELTVHFFEQPEYQYAQEKARLNERDYSAIARRHECVWSRRIRYGRMHCIRAHKYPSWGKFDFVDAACSATLVHIVKSIQVSPLW